MNGRTTLLVLISGIALGLVTSRYLTFSYPGWIDVVLVIALVLYLAFRLGVFQFLSIKNANKDR